MKVTSALKFFALSLLAGFVTVIATQSVSPPRAVQAAGATLSFPTASCSGLSATVTLAWTPAAGASQVWIDLSTVDNGFVSGSYQRVGPFAGGSDAYTWSGLQTHTPYFWRVDSTTPAGRELSETGVFVVCSEPILLASNPDCTNNTDAAVSFRWAPSVPATRQQWIDVSASGSFAPGAFAGYGPYSPAANSFQLPRLDNGGYAYRLNSQLQDGSWRSSITRTFVVDCASGADIDLHHTGDKLVYKDLGIYAPVNVRKVGPDGAMLNPEGKDDVVRYDFSGFPGLGGYAGSGGTTVLAGHLDYRPYYEAVFYNLTKAEPGDVIEYHRADGTVKRFSVAWAGAVPFEESLNEYITSTNPESMVLITCDGGFDEAAGGYVDRAIIYAVAID